MARRLRGQRGGSMTTEEVIKALRLMEHVESIVATYEPGEVRSNTTVRELKEACRVAAGALNAQLPRKLDRSRWEGCEHCKGDLEGYTSCFRDAEGRSRRLYIPEGKAMIVAPGKYNHQFCIPIKYCPFCGRPLTEESWAELERRIGGNDGTADV